MNFCTASWKSSVNLKMMACLLMMKPMKNKYVKCLMKSIKKSSNFEMMKHLFYAMLVALGATAFLSCSEDEETISFPDGDEIRVESCVDNFHLVLPIGDYVINGKKVKSSTIGFINNLGVGEPPYQIQGAKGSITSVEGTYEGRIDVTKCSALEKLEINDLNDVNASNCLNLNFVSIKSIWPGNTLNFSGCTNLSEIEFSGGSKVNVLDLSRSGITEFLQDDESFMDYCYLLDFSECTKLKRVVLKEWNLEDAEVSFNGCTALTSFKGSYYTDYGSGYVFKNYRNETLDFSGCTSLDTVDCEYFLPRNLILDGCTSLRYLDCNDSYNYIHDYNLIPPFDTLDLRACPALTYLNCSYIGLTSLDISENKNLRAISCYGNDFSEKEINKIYEDLPVVEDGYIVVDYDDFFREPIGNYEIAESKGWRVSYTRLN